MCRVAAETSTRKPGPLERGGTLEGDKAAGKDAGAAARASAASDAAAALVASPAADADPRLAPLVAAARSAAAAV